MVGERKEIQMTREKELGRDGWGKGKVAEFRGIQVAAKLLFKELQSPYYQHAFLREMMAARVRHPNLVQFLGASMDEEMVILTELMPTSLRKHLTRNPHSTPSLLPSLWTWPGRSTILTLCSLIPPFTETSAVLTFS